MRRVNWKTGLSRRKFLSYLTFPAALSVVKPGDLLAKSSRDSSIVDTSNPPKI